jgi:hypothetical protein
MQFARRSSASPHPILERRAAGLLDLEFQVS